MPPSHRLSIHNPASVIASSTERETAENPSSQQIETVLCERPHRVYFFNWKVSQVLSLTGSPPKTYECLINFVSIPHPAAHPQQIDKPHDVIDDLYVRFPT